MQVGGMSLRINEPRKLLTSMSVCYLGPYAATVGTSLLTVLPFEVQEEEESSSREHTWSGFKEQPVLFVMMEV